MSRQSLLGVRRSQYRLSRTLLEDARALRQRRFEDDVDTGAIVPSNLSAIGRTGGVQADLAGLADLLSQAHRGADTTPADAAALDGTTTGEQTSDVEAVIAATQTPRGKRSTRSSGSAHHAGTGGDCATDGTGATTDLDPLSALEDLHRRAQQNQEHLP